MPIMTSLNAQSYKPWYASRYNIKTLEELGVERLKTEKEIFLVKRNTGILLTTGGIALTLIGGYLAVQDIAPFDEERKSSSRGDFFGIVGLGMSVAGIVT